MPTYQYRCTSCGDELEVVQKFTDPPLSECPACTGALRKVYNAVGVVFKGSGFYRTDSRTTPGDSGASGGDGDKPAKADTPASASSGTPEKSAAGGTGDGKTGRTSEAAGSKGKVPAASSSPSTGS